MRMYLSSIFDSGRQQHKTLQYSTYCTVLLVFVSKIITFKSRSTTTVTGSTATTPNVAMTAVTENKGDPEVLSDEPGLSSAALSITFLHDVDNDADADADTIVSSISISTPKPKSTPNVFRPEYTHQIVGMDESWGSMYQPYQHVVDEELQKWKREFEKNSAKKHQDDDGDASVNSSDVWLHKSHRNHQSATHELHVQIHLSPSCQSCQVDIRQRPKNLKIGKQTQALLAFGTVGDDASSASKGPCTKRLKINDDTENISKNKKLDEKDGKGTLYGDDKTEDISNRSIQEGENMIRTTLSKALPSIIVNNREVDANKNEDKDGFLFKPIGRILEEYTVTSTASASTPMSSSSSFVITIADARQSSSTPSDDNQNESNDNEVLRFHNNVQRLALWFIENADDVDISDESTGGYWKVLYVFRKHPRTAVETATGVTSERCDDDGCRYSLVGYMTLYHFISLFHKPEGGIIVRICQALLLPPYQGQGHGGRLIRALYNFAGDQNRNNTISGNNRQNTKFAINDELSSSYKIVQVNVEDPAPGFVALRNKTDFLYVFENISHWSEEDSYWPSRSMSRPFEPLVQTATISGDDEWTKVKAMLDDDDLFQPLSENDAMYASFVSKLTVRQIQIIREILVIWKIGSHFDLSELYGGGNGAASGVAVGTMGHDQEIKTELFKKTRLMIKRRLNKDHRDELTALPTKDDQKLHLSKLFDGELKRYMKIVSSLKN